jgi:hypothetical protein
MCVRTLKLELELLYTLHVHFTAVLHTTCKKMCLAKCVAANEVSGATGVCIYNKYNPRSTISLSHSLALSRSLARALSLPPPPLPHPRSLPPFILPIQPGTFPKDQSHDVKWRNQRCTLS